jgi:hypothetical protein
METPENLIAIFTPVKRSPSLRPSLRAAELARAFDFSAGLALFGGLV